MSGPSNETEAEALQRRQVEALEKIADLLSLIVDADMGSIGITPFMRQNNPMEVEIVNPDHEER